MQLDNNDAGCGLKPILALLGTTRKGSARPHLFLPNEQIAIRAIPMFAFHRDHPISIAATFLTAGSAYWLPTPTDSIETKTGLVAKDDSRDTTALISSYQNE